METGDAHAALQGVTWLVMDEMLFHSTMDQLELYAQLQQRGGLKDEELKYHEIRHAAAALLLTCAAAEGHGNYIAQSSIVGTLPNHLSLTIGVWERLESVLRPEAKWMYLSALVTGNASILSPGEAPFQHYLDAVRRRNNLVAHPKLGFRKVTLSPGEQPDWTDFKEVTEVTLGNAKLAIEAVRGMLQRLYRGAGYPQKLPVWAQ